MLVELLEAYSRLARTCASEMNGNRFHWRQARELRVTKWQALAGVTYMKVKKAVLRL